MEIINSPLWNEVQDVMVSGETSANFTWNALIHYAGIDYRVLQVVQVNNVRDYVSSYREDLTCTLMIPLGKYARRIYPNRRDLEITLIKTPLTERSAEIDNDKPILTERYKANLINEDTAPTDGQGHEYTDEDKLDLSDILEVHFELRTFAVDQIRNLSFGGNWRRDTTDEVIRTILTTESSRIEVSEEHKLKGVTIVEGDNRAKYEQLNFTDGTPLIDLPGVMQKRWGVYNSGIGHFIQDLYWYVYSLYDPKELDTRKKSATLIIVPKNKLSNVERTFKINGNHATIIITGETGVQDDVGAQYLNDGIGARYSDASKQVANWGQTRDNKLILNRTKLNSEYVAQERQTQNQNLAPVVRSRITSNPYPIASSLNARAGGYFKAVWENHDVSVLTPGMPMRILNFDNGELVEYEGILHHVISRNVQVGDLPSKVYRNLCVLMVFVKKVKYEQIVESE